MRMRDGFAQVGETIDYNFIVINTGNVTISNITISDPLPGIVLSGNPINLNPGQSDTSTFTATYTLIQADLDANQVTNQAIATGQDVNNVTVTDDSDNNSSLEDDPTVVTFDFDICNPDAGSPDNDGDGIPDICDLDDDNDGILDADEGFTPSVNVTSFTNLDASVLPSTGTNGATSGSLGIIENCDGPFQTNFDIASTVGGVPNIFFFRNNNSILISYSGTSGSSEITYTFSEEVNVRLDLAGNDAFESITFITPYDVITPGSGSTIESTNPVVWNNGNNGDFTEFQFNNVTSITLGIEGNNLTQQQRIFISDFMGNAICQDTNLNGVYDHVEFDSDSDGCSDANEAYANTNADGGDGGAFGLGTPTLANGGVNANGLVIIADINVSGDAYTNTVPTTTLGRNTFQQGVTLSITQDPSSQTITETNSVTFSAIAEVNRLITQPSTLVTDVDYQWQVSTNGGGTFTDISGESGTVASGTEVSLTLTNVTAGADGNRYRMVASSQANICDVATSSAVTLNVIAADATIALIKTGVFNDVNGDGFAQIGETITYSFEVTNTGNLAVTNITLSDPLPGIVLSGGIISLNPGQSDNNTFTGTYTLTQADIDNGSVSNQATVTGDSPAGTNDVSDLSDNNSNLENDPTTTTFGQNP